MSSCCEEEAEEAASVLLVMGGSLLGNERENCVGVGCCACRFLGGGKGEESGGRLRRRQLCRLPVGGGCRVMAEGCNTI